MLVDVTTRRLLFVVLFAVAMLAVAPSAHAYVTEVPPADLARLLELPAFRDWSIDPDNPVTLDPSMIECWMCHGNDGGRSGPHGGYVTTTNKCATCHSAHAASADSMVLLPAATALETCETCHDGTSGTGVYGAIEARGQYVNSDHNMVDLSTSIPGGDAATGGSRDGVVFSGVSGGLTCTDCHHPHGTNVITEPFVGDRGRSDADTDPDNPVESTRILRQQPIGGLTSISYYGSDWCASCHQGRLSQHSSGSSVNNHDVDSEDSQSTPFRYENVVYDDGTMGGLGHTNHGYVMPDKLAPGAPRLSNQAGHFPICQQCHEDARRVGDVTTGYIDTSTEEFTITAVDGSPDDDPANPDVPGSSDNPRFQVFPHESNNYYLLLEEEDDLCTNCHKKG